MAPGRLLLPALALILAALSLPRATAQAPPDKVSPELARELQAGATEFLVILTHQADLSGAADLPGRPAKSTWVVGRLRQTADSEQAAVRELLNGRGARYRPFWIVNALLVRGDASLAAFLSRRPEVARLIANPRVHPVLPRPQPLPGDAPSNPAPGTIEWNVARVRAPEVWQTYGVRGEGVVVAVNDTGVMWEHEALREQYRGWDAEAQAASHDYNWHDAFGQFTAPHDDYGHGTHVAGTIVGDNQAGQNQVTTQLYFPFVSAADGGGGAGAYRQAPGPRSAGTRHQIGMAPAARWIACRNMEGGAGSVASYLDCFQWFLAPTPIHGGEGKPELAPDIINNSWVCTLEEGCTDDQLAVLQQAAGTVRAAGILEVAAAGNDGNVNCGTVADPPAIYSELLSIGATTDDSANPLAGFSSIGPVLRDGSERSKPDLVAPGAAIYSSQNESPTAYGFSSGTSMAAPAVSGVAALVLSAAPHLSGKVELVERILRETARPLTENRTVGHPGGACLADGSEYPNLLYGWGLVDALAAVEVGRSCPMADFDGDGVVGDDDLALLRAALDQPVTVLTGAFDLNGDGVLDTTDRNLASGQRGASCEFREPRATRSIP